MGEWCDRCGRLYEETTNSVKPSNLCWNCYRELKNTIIKIIIADNEEELKDGE